MLKNKYSAPTRRRRVNKKVKTCMAHFPRYPRPSPVGIFKIYKFTIFTKTASASLSIAILDYRLPQYSFYPFNAFIHQSFDFRGCKYDSDQFPCYTCISMVLCVYAY